MQPEIISMGEPMLEFNATEDGLLSDAEQFSVGWGGDTSNFAIAASRLGGKVGYLTRLGKDAFGDSFMNLWKSEKIDTSHVELDETASTGIYFISRKDKEHFFTYYRKDSAASRMTPSFVPHTYIRNAKLLHVSGISQAISATACDAVFTAINTAIEAGVKISYDPNLRLKLWPIERAKAIIHETMAMADLVLPSLEDAVALTGLDSPEDIVRFYLELGRPKTVILKLGGEGAILGESEMIDGFSIPHLKKFSPFKVNSVDMSGAGDTFDGAFAAAYLAGKETDKCVEFANAAAALTTTGKGCVKPIPSVLAVEKLLQSAV